MQSGVASASNASWTALRMLIGISAFAWAGFILSSGTPNPLWPAYLIAGGLFGAMATILTRHAGRRFLGRLLLVLGWLSLTALAAALVLHPGSDRFMEFVPIEQFIALTLLPLPLWLFLSGRPRKP